MQRRKRGADGDGAVALFPSDADRVLAGGRIKAALFLRAFVNGQATGWMGTLAEYVLDGASVTARCGGDARLTSLD